MTGRPLWEFSLSTSTAGEEAAVALFDATFQLPSSVFIDAETGAVKVCVYREASGRQRSRLRTLLQAGLVGLRACGLDFGRAQIRVRRVRREQWAESWKRHFQPLEIGRALLIKPSWSRRPPRRNQAVVILDPGLSFGTGRHPTTLFCLQHLVRHRRKQQPQSFLDIGTGSGILAAAAAAIGYKPVKAFDFDRAAVRISRENALANGLDSLIQIHRKDLSRLPMRSREKFDLICANLTADLLLSQRRRILNRLASGGVLVLAGILRKQFKEVRKAYETRGMRLISNQTGGEWQSGAFHRC
jgi:ribosomal protein L11 methyltransferase